MSNEDKKKVIEEKLTTVYDPEFPMADVFTLWLIYNVDVDELLAEVNVLMTFTTPACPLADVIEAMVKNAVLEIVPDYDVKIEITFDPMWSIKMIRDPDLLRMFE